MGNRRKVSNWSNLDIRALTPRLMYAGFLIVLINVFGCVPSAITPTATPSPPPTDVTPTLPPGCAPNAIIISAVYSGEVDFYLQDIMRDFNQYSAQGARNPATHAPLAVNGRPICVSGQPVRAGTVRTGLVNAITAPNNQTVVRPTIWSPSVSHWLLLANHDTGRELFDMSQTRATALAPVVIAIWQSRLEAIRNHVGYEDIGWEELLAVLTSPNGWCDYGLPNCRTAVYYGHTNPYNSPTGLSTLISEFYASARAVEGETPRALTRLHVSDAQIRLGVREIEELIRHYSDRTTEFIFYIAQGPDYVDFVALEENDVIYINQGQNPAGVPIARPPEPLVALYPREGTFIHDHPFGIVNADWVTPEQHEAAVVFTDYVLTAQVQQFIMSRGFRPVNPAVPIAFPIDAVNGVDPANPTTTLTMPNIDTLRAIQESWSYVKKQADITLLIDVSGSMRDDDKLTQAQAASHAFLDAMENDQMQHDNQVGLVAFADQVHQIIPVDNLETNGEMLRTEIDALTADGGTALYDAVVTTINGLSQTDCRNRIRAIVLLSDGQDTDSQSTLPEVTDNIETSLATPCPILVIAVAYGDNADMQTLNNIARSSRTQTLIGDPDNIVQILDIIRGYF
jgi:Ca-activated chloride channel family protein